MKYERNKIDPTGIIKRFDDIKKQLTNSGYESSGIYTRICQQEIFLKHQIPQLVQYVSKLNKCFSFMALTLILVISGAFIYASAIFLNNVAGSAQPIDAVSKLQSIDSVVSIIIAGVVSIASVMIWSNEQSHKKINKSLQDLRAFIHILDMHQLAKPTGSIGALKDGLVIASAEQQQIYVSCIRDSILISGKIAALIYQISSDSRSKSEAAEVEQLCESISMRLLLKYGEFINWHRPSVDL